MHLKDWIEADILVAVLEGVVVNLHLHLVPASATFDICSWKIVSSCDTTIRHLILECSFSLRPHKSHTRCTRVTSSCKYSIDAAQVLLTQQLSYNGAHPCPPDVLVIPCSVPGVSYDLLSSVTLIVLQILHTIPCSVTQFKTTQR